MSDTAHAMSVVRKYAKGGRVDTNPSMAQRKAGNYKMGHIDFQGLPITIENPKGSIRKGIDHTGKRWSTKMLDDYGYIKGTNGHDGDHVDVFIGPHKKSDRVFVIDQIHNYDKEKFDEHKCMLGYKSKQQAFRIYKKSYGPSYGSRHEAAAITEISMDAFKEWLKGGGGKKPLAPDVPKYQEGGVVPLPPEDPRDWSDRLPRILQNIDPGPGVEEIPPDLMLAAKGITARDKLIYDPDEIASQRTRPDYAPPAWSVQRSFADGGDVSDEGESWEPPPEPFEAGYPEPSPPAPPQPSVQSAVSALSAQRHGTQPPPIPAVTPPGEQSLTAYKPSFAERLTQLAEGEHPSEYRKRLAREGVSALEWTPGIGQALVGQEAIQKGDYQQAALAFLPGAKAAAPVGAVAKSINAQLGKTLFELEPSLVKSAKPISGPMGSGGGRMYQLADNSQWFIKPVQSLDHAKNEALTSAFYRELGIPSADAHITQLNGKPAIASRKIEGVELNKVWGDTDNYFKDLQDHFAADAWLANWDSIGTGKNNIMVDSTGKAHRIDFGGGIRYRAMGSPKLDAFGKNVLETESMKNTLYDAGEVFWNVPLHPGDPTANKIANMPDEKIRQLVDIYGPEGAYDKKKLADTLILRRDDLAKQYGIQKMQPLEAATAGRSSFDMPPSTIKNAVKVSDTFGINNGGLYQLPDGSYHYVKIPEGGLKQAKAEALAYQLAKLAGVPVPEINLTQLNGKAAIASKMVEGQQISEIDPSHYGKINNLNETFPFHAWINNRDAVGAGVTNPKGNIIVDKNWNPTFIDLGGSFGLGGLGGTKSFGHSVPELEGMLDPGVNPTIAEVFKGHVFSPDNKIAQNIANIPNDTIYDLVKKYGPISGGERDLLFAKLVNRKNEIAEKYGLAERPSVGAPEAPLPGAKAAWEDKKAAFMEGKPQSEAWSPKDTHSIMSLKKTSTPTQLVHAVMNHEPVDAFKAKKLTAKQLEKIKTHFDNADKHELVTALSDLSPEQQATVKAWMSPKTASAVKKAQADIEPRSYAGMIVEKNGANTQKMAKSAFNLAMNKSPEFVDEVYKYLPYDLQADFTEDLNNYIRKKGFDPWKDNIRNKTPKLTDQELYESKQEMQEFHEASLASGLASGEFTLGKGIKFSKNAPLPDEAFHMMDWQSYEPRLTHEYGYEPPKLSKISRQKAEELGFGTKFTIYRGEKSEHGATYEDPYPTKFIPAEQLAHKEKGYFGADIRDVAKEYATWQHDLDLGGKHLIGEYIFRPPSGKTAEVDWHAVNHYAGYNQSSMVRIISAAQQRDLDLVAVHGVSDLGHHNHTQYVILKPEGLRSLEAKFGKDKLHLMYPHLGIAAGAFLGTAIVKGAQGEE